MSATTIESRQVQDAVIIGGGFYGAAIAIYLAKQRGLKHITLLEREPALLMRASYNNQARVHNGYHYPRSFTTAYRSRINLPKFVHDWQPAVTQDITKLYAIASRNSKVTSKQFVRFCKDIGAEITPASPPLKKLFNPHLIENVFLAEEYVFDSKKLAKLATQELQESNVRVRLETQATGISKGNSVCEVTTESSTHGRALIKSRYVFNCTYSGLNQFKKSIHSPRASLKHEITEMALIQPPSQLENLGITVMDGPFFSIMPFPDRGLHTLSHVRYTPHLHWVDQQGIDPYPRLREYERITRVDRMLRDVARYLPAIADSTYVDSLFEVKTILTKNEGDDGRPILFERDPELPGCYSILGGKIDNIYDVLEKLDSEAFQ